MFSFRELFIFISEGAHQNKSLNARSAGIKRNISYSFLYKLFDFVFGLIVVRLGVEYLGKTEYGVWLTINSMIYWFALVDVGLGHGLRNKLAEQFSSGTNQIVNKYISTSYFVLMIICGSLIIILLVVVYFVNWNFVFNTYSITNSDLVITVYIVIVSFFIRLPLQLIHGIYYALQKSSYIDLITTLTRFLNLLILLFITQISQNSLILFSLSYSISPLFVLALFSFIFFMRRYKLYKPKLKYIDISCAKNIMGLGVKFFAIQISGIILYSTSNIVIVQFFSPTEVTPYQLSQTYFSYSLTAFLVILSPYWSAVTEAFTKNDHSWILRSIRKLEKIWVLMSLLVVIMLAVSSIVYNYWLGGKVDIPVILSIGWAIFFVLKMLTTIYHQYLNGIGKILVQLYTSIFSAIIAIPLMFLFSKVFELGLPGILLATLILQLFSLIVSSKQYYDLVFNKAQGVWNR